MQMVELILPVAIETRTYTGRRGNRTTFLASRVSRSEEFMVIKIVCAHTQQQCHIERCAHLNI